MLRCYWLLLALTLAGCLNLSPQLRRQSAAELAATAGWEAMRLPVDGFVLAAFVPHEAPSGDDTLTVYIEGDGLAWISRREPSQDPTPMQPIGLKLALRHPHGTAVYLGRPCQYVDKTDANKCRITWWTDRRFAPEVINASNQAIDLLKERFGGRYIALVGYSGGGAIATLVAARRNDVAHLTTVAGNLDHHTWTEYHHTAPLTGSLNPSDAWQSLAGIPQMHFIGELDSNITRDVAESYIARFPENQRPQLQIVEKFDHACCWVEKWPELYPW
jgi:dienelactone hydrolase